MSSFNHNKGGKFKGRDWTEDLPSDADIILHVFCVYVNLHHPLDPRYPDGKLFGQKYVALRPEEKKEKGSNFIYKEKTTPPQYNVVSNGITYEIPEVNMLKRLYGELKPTFLVKTISVVF